jgi:hypothetical protein
MIGSLLSGSKEKVPCRIEVEQTWESLHAHVELQADVDIEPGDEVQILGEPIQVDFGDQAVFQRRAEIRHAGLLQRIWTKLTGDFEFMELLEFSFTGRNKL